MRQAINQTLPEKMRAGGKGVVENVLAQIECKFCSTEIKKSLFHESVW
jgi:hypothetical protein